MVKLFKVLRPTGSTLDSGGPCSLVLWWCSHSHQRGRAAPNGGIILKFGFFKII
jgi:hypothetical protein